MSLNRILLASVVMVAASTANAQTSRVRYGAEVPREVRVIYARGLDYLVRSQNDLGSWAKGTGIDGMCVMAFMASGEDPNYGKYAESVRRAIRDIIRIQDPKTGYLTDSGYHHGFAMLALAEAYGQINEELLWKGQPNADKRRSIGQALELAVRCAVTGQSKKKSKAHPAAGGWRYTIGDGDTDTSVSGAVLMGLLGARNAGIEVPDTCIEEALNLYRGFTEADGTVGYANKGDSRHWLHNRSAIATLVFAIGKKKNWKEYQATLAFSTNDLTSVRTAHPYYYRYYIAQALFQGDYASWRKWNRDAIDDLVDLQQKDGSFDGGTWGAPYGTSISLLALALNYRFLPIYER